MPAVLSDFASPGLSVFCRRQCNRQSGVVGVMNELYVGAFQQFYTIWRTEHKTIADSGFVLAGNISSTYIYLLAKLHQSQPKLYTVDVLVSVGGLHRKKLAQFFCQFLPW